MANPQCENGFTKIANEIIDELVKTPLLGAELQVCLFVVRKTYGYGKKEDAISLTQFEQATNKSRPTIVKALKNLQLVNILQLVKVGDSRISSNIYTFNKNYETWKLVKPPKLVKYNNSTSKVNASELVKTPKHTKENTKENTKEKEFILPDWMPKDLWMAYLEVRKKKRAPSTIHALNLCIKSINKLHELGNDRIAVIEKSVERGYTGFFELSGGNNGTKTTIGTNTYRKNYNDRQLDPETAAAADKINEQYYKDKAALANSQDGKKALSDR